MQLFYNPELNSASKTIKFGKKESGHILKSLRKEMGDKLYITNGKGYLFLAKLSNDNPNKCLAKIIDVSFHQPPNHNLHLAVAPTKQNQRFEWFLEKATEIGISKITPLICKNSERRKVKLNRFNRVLQSAMKQSLQYYLPELAEPISFNKFIEQEKTEQAFIAHCTPEEKQFLQQIAYPHKKTTLLIGPEGDFSSKEIKTALNHNYQPISLGKNRLRTETAAVAACHTISLINQR